MVIFSVVLLAVQLFNSVSVDQLYLCFSLHMVGNGCLAPNSDVPHSSSPLFGTSPLGEMQ